MPEAFREARQRRLDDGVGDVIALVANGRDGYDVPGLEHVAQLVLAGKPADEKFVQEAEAEAEAGRQDQRERKHQLLSGEARVIRRQRLGGDGGVGNLQARQRVELAQAPQQVLVLAARDAALLLQLVEVCQRAGGQVRIQDRSPEFLLEAVAA